MDVRIAALIAIVTIAVAAFYVMLKTRACE